MAGSHRATRADKPDEPESRPRKRSHGLTPLAVAVAVVLALIPAAWLTVRRLGDDPTTPAASSTSSPTRLPIPPISGSATPDQKATASKQPKPKQSPASIPPIDEDPPRRLVSGTLLDTGFDNAVEPSGGELTAPSDDEVARWGSRGSPGSPGSDTVVVVGRMSAGAPFAELGELAKGATVIVRTNEGELTYRVTGTSRKPVDTLLEDPALATKRPGRLVLVGNAYSASGDRLTSDLVVVARLSAAKASA